MDARLLGERLRMIRKHLGISQQQLAEATSLTQPAISRLENGEEIYASALLAVLSFYQDKISLDHLFDPTMDTTDGSQLYCSCYELRQRLDSRLAVIAHNLEKSLEHIAVLRIQK